MPYSLVGCMSAKMGGCHHVRRGKVLSYKLYIYVYIMYIYTLIHIMCVCVFVSSFLRLYARFKSFFWACFPTKTNPPDVAQPKTNTDLPFFHANV